MSMIYYLPPTIQVCCTKTFLSKKFEMKDLGETSFVLGIQMHRDHFQGILGLSQKWYIEKVMQGFDKFSLSQYPKTNLEVQEMQKVPYASVIMSLMYA